MTLQDFREQLQNSNAALKDSHDMFSASQNQLAAYQDDLDAQEKLNEEWKKENEELKSEITSNAERASQAKELEPAIERLEAEKKELLELSKELEAAKASTEEARLATEKKMHDIQVTAEQYCWPTTACWTMGIGESNAENRLMSTAIVNQGHGGRVGSRNRRRGARLLRSRTCSRSDYGPEPGPGSLVWIKSPWKSASTSNQATGQNSYHRLISSCFRQFWQPLQNYNVWFWGVKLCALV